MRNGLGAKAGPPDGGEDDGSGQNLPLFHGAYRFQADFQGNAYNYWLDSIWRLLVMKRSNPPKRTEVTFHYFSLEFFSTICNNSTNLI